MKKLIAISILIALFGCSEDKKDTSQEVSDDITTINNVKTNEVAFSAASMDLISTTNVTIQSIVSVSQPSIVDLNNIVITAGELINNTPYEIDQLTLTNGSNTHWVTLSSTLPKYSKGNIGSEWDGYYLLNQTPLANSTFEYESSVVLENYPNSVHSNSEQRLTGERVQMYDRFMTNAPSTLSEVTAHLTDICSDNSDCSSYGESVINYAADTYYAKSVSGMNSRIWIDTDVWGLGSLTSLNFTSSTKNGNMNIWMHPTLIGNVHSESVSSQMASWQAFVHELYHNYGFTHNSGWASSNGVDDMFGEKVVNRYLPTYGDKLILSDTIIQQYEKTANLTYTFKLGLSELADKISVRLLSTKDLSATVTKSDSDFTVTFTEIPETDVYVSFYSDNSLQMSSVVLNKFILNVASATSMSSFDDEISTWLSEYDVINVTTYDGVWRSEFTLPSTDVDTGKVINFKASATYSSTVYHDGSGDVITTGNSVSYHFNGFLWEKTTQ